MFYHLRAPLPVLDLHGPLVQDQHGAGGDHEQDRDKLGEEVYQYSIGILYGGAL